MAVPDSRGVWYSAPVKSYADAVKRATRAAETLLEAAPDYAAAPVLH
jgi:hypothetical protein